MNDPTISDALNNCPRFLDEIQNQPQWKLCFHAAASLGVLGLVQYAVEWDHVDVDKKNSSGWTALMYASSFGHEAVVDYIVQHLAWPDLQNQDGHTALMLAVVSSNDAVVKRLLKCKCDVELRDKKGWSALLHAAHLGFNHIVQLLIEHGADINCTEKEYGYTPLMIAAKEGLENIVSVFLQHETNVLVKSYYGDTAYSLASEFGHQKVVTLLERYLYTINNGSCNAVFGSFPQSPYSQDKKMLPNANIQQLSVTASHSFLELKLFLQAIGLEKYFHVFEEQAVDLPVFLTLNDKDFQEIGVRLLGPRKKMCAAITRWHANAAAANSVEQANDDKFYFGFQGGANTKHSLTHKALDELKSDGTEL